MRARLEIHSNSLFREELIQQAKSLFNCQEKDIEILPDSLDPKSLIIFGIQQLILADHIECIYGDRDLYSSHLAKLRKRYLEFLEEELNLAIINNEARFLE